MLLELRRAPLPPVLSMCLPDDNVQDIVTIVTRLLSDSTVSKRKLASVVGKLLFASQAIYAGRTILRRLYHFIRPTEGKKSAVLRIPALRICSGGKELWKSGMASRSSFSMSGYQHQISTSPWMPVDGLVSVHTIRATNGSVGRGQTVRSVRYLLPYLF